LLSRPAPPAAAGGGGDVKTDRINSSRSLPSAACCAHAAPTNANATIHLNSILLLATIISLYQKLQKLEKYYLKNRFF
jgi:hypothetical protein